MTGLLLAVGFKANSSKTRALGGLAVLALLSVLPLAMAHDHVASPIDRLVHGFVEAFNTGDYEGGWIDSTGEFLFLYDEHEDEVAYWQDISADTLTRGRREFVQYCSSCHGLTGDGYGRSAQHLRPPPRVHSWPRRPSRVRPCSLRSSTPSVRAPQCCCSVCTRSPSA